MQLFDYNIDPKTKLTPPGHAIVQATFSQFISTIPGATQLHILFTNFHNSTDMGCETKQIISFFPSFMEKSLNIHSPGKPK
jgi:hypothetical protein